MSKLAQQLIEESLRTQHPVLDLGKCGLDGTEPILEHLGACDHLEALNFSDIHLVWNKKTQALETQNSTNKGEENTLVQLPSKLPLHLKALFVSGNYDNKWKINDLKPLQSLHQLSILTISYNQINDLSPLQNLNQSRILILSDNQINDLKPIQNLHQLNILTLNNNQINDFKPLQNLDQLNVLALDNNQINDLKPFQNLNQLTRLDLSDNQINDLKPLQNLKQLTKL